MLIRTRLVLIGLLPVLLFLLFIAGMMVTQLQLDSFREKAVFASHIEKNFFDLFVISHDMKEKNRFERSRQQWPPITRELGEQLPEARGMFSSADESELIETLLEYFEDSQRDFRELEQWLDQHHGRALNTAQQGYLSSLSERLHIGLQSAIPIASRIAAINQESAVAFDKRRENALAFALVFLAGVLLLILWPLMRGITRSIDNLKTGMNRAALGDLGSRIAMAGKDEFAQLARHFNEMISKLAEVTVARETLSAEVIERKRIEDALRHSEENLNRAQAVGQIGSWLLDIPANRLEWSAETYRMFGIPQQRAVDLETFVAAIHPDDRDFVLKVWGEAVAGVPYDIEHRIVVDGQVRWVRERARIERDAKGRPLTGIGTAQDVTELKRSERALRESESRFRNLVETTSDWIWEVDENIAFTYVSPKIHDVLGYEAAEIIGKTPFDLMAPEEAIRVADIAGTIAAMREPFINLENTSLHKDGHPVVIETSGVPVIGLEGKFCGYRGINRDITERKEFEEELKRSNVDLEQFSYAVSHDMRQPLRMISSYLQLLELKLAGQLDGEKRDYFDFAIDGAKRIDQMLVELLEYSRVGRMGEPPTRIDSRALLDEALQFLQPALDEAQAKLNIEGDWPNIFACHDEILRLFQNLIGNAAKFRVAARTPEITVTGGTVKNEWHLCVTDNGVGIIPEQIKRLFQVFRRLQTRTDYEGTGIGLALCRKIVEHHKGRIWAESAGEGQGSRFCVALPVLRGEG